MAVDSDDVLSELTKNTNKNTSNKKQKQSTLTGYKDRPALARRMRLDRNNSKSTYRTDIRERRDYIKVQCIRRGHTLDKAFEDFKPDVMYRLVKGVTCEMQVQYGKWWDLDLTRDLIHAICLDKVCNNNTKGRSKSKPNGSSEVGQSTNTSSSLMNTRAELLFTATKRHRQPVISGEDSDDAELFLQSKRRAPGTTLKTQPPLSPNTDTPMQYWPKDAADADPVTPINKTLRPGQPQTTPSTAGFVTLGYSSPLSTTPPLMASSPPDALVPRDPLPSNSASGAGTPGSLTNHVPQTQYPGVPQTQYPSVPQTRYSSVPQTQYDQVTASQALPGNVPTVAVFIKGRSPFHVPPKANYQEFEDSVSRRLQWEKNKFLLYRAKSGSKSEREWTAISSTSDWEKLVTRFGDLGVIVKVVEDSWFNSGGESKVR